MLAGRPIRADTLMRNLMMASRPSKLRRGTVVIVNVYCNYCLFSLAIRDSICE